MLGIVFSEFLEMVESTFSMDMVDDIIDAVDIESGGSYTSVGNYNHEEILKLVTALSEKTGTPVPDLVHAFGEHLYGRFVEKYPIFFEGIEHSIDFFETIENHIHVEVKKLYPQAELPTFDCKRLDDGSFEMIYSSTRPFADLAEGLMHGCISYYKDPYAISRTTLEDGSVKFLLTP